ncbi:fibrocystin-L-like [Hyperolius riggenbachi]|uniref:fibrocystin-L-like n=1 Tax=Hyperolius riggenbachi TaxID=752182 RepID=UPI0035A29560
MRNNVEFRQNRNRNELTNQEMRNELTNHDNKLMDAKFRLGATQQTVAVASAFYSGSYSDYSSQKSNSFYLQKGQPSYIEAYTGFGSSFIDIGLYKRGSPYSDQQTADAVNDVQMIQSRSDNILEKQIIALKNWTTTQQAVGEVQTITVTKYCDPPCPELYYSLIYGAEETGLLSADASAADVQSALNNLWSIQPDSVNVDVQTNDTQNVYTVTFNSQRGDFKLLSYQILDGSNITVVIEEQTKGVPDMRTFTLVWDNVYSKPLAVNASSADVQAAVWDMVSGQCLDVIAKQKEGPSVKYFRNYETDFTLSSSYRGFLTAETEPYCGRYSLKNPQVLYDYSETKTTTLEQYGLIKVSSFKKWHRSLLFTRPFLAQSVVNCIKDDGERPSLVWSKADICLNLAT